ncbi:MAG: hypothetical protein ACRDOI_11070 [Trebonia sp.]
MSGPLAKGALVKYDPTWPPIPVVTVFQYNPETMTHAWTQPEPPGKAGVESGNPMAVPGLPGESFDFTIYLNADDDVVSGIPIRQQVARRSGLGARLAALELLMYPVNGTGAASSRTGQLLGTVSSGLGSSKSAWGLPNSTVPVVLFYWNANRIVPVRVTTLSITETLYDEDLNPRNAQAQLGLRVLTPEELAAANPAPGTATDLAVVAYNQTLATRRLLAAANTASLAGSIFSQLPH